MKTFSNLTTFLVAFFSFIGGLVAVPAVFVLASEIDSVWNLAFWVVFSLTLCLGGLSLLCDFSHSVSNR